jgi:hypothetical protein
MYRRQSKQISYEGRQGASDKRANNRVAEFGSNMAESGRWRAPVPSQVYSSSDKLDRIPKDHSYYFGGQPELYYAAEFIKDLNKRITEREAEPEDDLT